MPTREPPTSEDLAWATTAWSNFLGADHVVLDRELLKPVQTATFPTRPKVPVALRPKNRFEVQACLRVATAHRVPLHPISRGLNWGYGSRVPNVHGACLLDLSRLDQIVAVDTVLGTITVQPGVTYNRVLQALDGTDWMLPGPGSSGHASVIGHVMDGGVSDGLVPLRRLAVRELEVVLADGETVVTTGAGMVTDAESRGLWPSSVGPDLTGLFIQSNLGVVTQMTIALQRIPPAWASFHFTLTDPAKLVAVLDALRILRRDGRIETSVSLFNDVRLFTMLSLYPYVETAGQTPLPEPWRKQLRGAISEAVWVGEGAIRATDSNHLGSLAAGLYGNLGKWVDGLTFHSQRTASGHFDPKAGSSLQSAYWRKRQWPSDDLHPDRDGVGLLWCAPILPLVGDDIDACVRSFEATLLKHGLDPSLSVRLIDERVAVVLAGLHWDRDDADVEAAAMECHAELRATCAQHGWMPYRTGLLGLHPDTPVDPGTVTLLKRLKEALDPSDILAPGRYDQRDRWPE